MVSKKGKKKNGKQMVKVVVQQQSQKKSKRKNRGKRLTGSGDYAFGPFERLGSYGGARVGRAADAAIFGSGDYAIKRNSIMPSSSGVMNFTTNKHSHRITGSEFMFQVTSSATAGAFNLQSIQLSADNPQLFPALKQLAANYSQFKFHGLVLEYKPLSGDALTSTNTTLGRVVMATNYNVYAPNFNSTREMEAYEFCTACKPSIGMLHPIECSPAESPVDIFNTSPSANVNVSAATVGGSVGFPLIDKRFQSLGNFQIATDRFQGTSVLAGEIWVHFDVECLKPRLWATMGSAVQYYAATGVTSALAAATPWAPFNVNVPTGILVSKSGDFNTFVNGTALNFTNPDGSNITSGCFMIQTFANGGGAAGLGTLGATGGYGVAPLTGVGNTFNSLNIATAGVLCSQWWVNITADGTITWTGTTQPTGSVTARFTVTRMPPDYFTAQ